MLKEIEEIEEMERLFNKLRIELAMDILTAYMYNPDLIPEAHKDLVNQIIDLSYMLIAHKNSVTAGLN